MKRSTFVAYSLGYPHAAAIVPDHVVGQVRLANRLWDHHVELHRSCEEVVAVPLGDLPEVAGASAWAEQCEGCWGSLKIAFRDHRISRSRINETRATRSPKVALAGPRAPLVSG